MKKRRKKKKSFIYILIFITFVIALICFISYTLQERAKAIEELERKFEEQQKIKKKRGRFGIRVVLDKNGNIIEIEFTFSKKNPVLSKFSADRFFEMETMFKKLLKWDIHNDEKKIVHLKFLLSFDIPRAIRL